MDSRLVKLINSSVFDHNLTSDQYQSIYDEANHIKKILEYENIDPESSQYMPMLVFFTIPFGLGFPSSGNVVELVCAADMTANTFWEYVCEKLFLDIDTCQPNRNTALVQAKDLEACDALVECQYTLAISYARYSPPMPDQTEIAAIAAFRNPVLGKAFDYQETVHHFSDLDISQCMHLGGLHDAEQTRMVPEPREDFSAVTDSNGTIRHLWGFRLLEDWATSAGLLSQSCRMLTDECLFYLCWAATSGIDCDSFNDEHDLVKAILNSRTFCEIADCSKPLTVNTPSGRNLAANMTPEAVEAFRRAVRYSRAAAQQKLSYDLRAFRVEYDVYVKIRFLLWGKSAVQTSYHDLLLGVQQHLRENSEVTARIWPYSIATAADRQYGEETFLLGISRSSKPGTGDVDLSQLLIEYIDKLQYHKDAVTISVEVLSQQQLSSWFVSRSNELTKPSDPPPVEGSSVGSNRFRTASAAMNRLLWDPKHVSIHYEIGYLDRFEKELMWKTLEKWERLTEEEEFIPEHRIRKIRRKIDKFVVWDRELREDRT